MPFQNRGNMALPLLVSGICVLSSLTPQAQANQVTQAKSSASQVHSNPAAKFQEQTADKIPGGSDLQDLQAAGGHFAWVEEKARTNKWTVYADGKQIGRKYDGVKFLKFSPHGNHLAYFGQRDSRWLIVLDGKEYSSYSSVTPVVFQPEGSSWAFGGCVTDKVCQVLVDGEPIGEIFEQVSLPVYSSDGKRLAYIGQSQSNDKWIAVVDGKKIGRQVDDVSCMGFSPDSTIFLLCGLTKKLGWTYFIDGTPGPYFVQLTPVSFSTDGGHYVYGGSSTKFAFKRDETIGTIVLDGKSEATYEGNGLPGEWLALLDAPIIAASVYSGGFYLPSLLLEPGHLLPESRGLSAKMNGISDPVFDSHGDPVYAARRGKNDFVVVEGTQAGPRFDDVVSQIVLSKDGAHYAYVALRGKDFVQVLDNQPGPAVPLDSGAISPVKKRSSEDSGSPVPDKPPSVYLNEFSVGWVQLTPHAERFAYEIVKGGQGFEAGMTPRAQRIVVLDAQPGKRYNALGISTIQFSEDERHFWYTVWGAAGKKSLIVVDGQASKRYDNLTEAQLDPDAKAVLSFARAGSRILRVTVFLTESPSQ